MSDLAVMYLLGVLCGGALGVVLLTLVQRGGDGWHDALKGQTKLQQMRDAGIGVKRD